MAIPGVVPAGNSHSYSTRGEPMEKEYAATYHFGNTVVHVVAPPPMTKEEIEKVLRECQDAAWKIWTSLTREEQLKFNAESEAE